MADLLSLPGVGRKSANILLGNAFGQDVIGVDTHVLRVSQRLGLTRNTDPDKVEADLMPLVPAGKRVRFCHLLQYHGRRVCLAKRPEDRPQRASDVVHELEAILTPRSGTLATDATATGTHGLPRALAWYTTAVAAVGIIAKSLTEYVGLPRWVLPGALILMALGLPAIALVAYVHHPTVRARPASFQNWLSPSSVMRCPFSRSRLISMSFNPPSLPAACRTFGRPRTTTDVWDDGPP